MTDSAIFRFLLLKYPVVSATGTLAVVHDLDYIVSWNYKHMVNIAVRRLVNSTNIRMGYNPIEIISPEEVTGDGEMEI